MDITQEIVVTQAAKKAALEAIDLKSEYDPKEEYVAVVLQAALPHLKVVESEARSRQMDARQPYPNLLPTRGYRGLETAPVRIPEVRIPFTGDVPVRGYPTDGGADLRLKNDLDLPPGEFTKVPLATRVNIPPGYVGLLVPRSSVGALGVISHPGLIDAGYTGELSAIVHNQTKYTLHLKEGARVMQIIILPAPRVEYVQVEDLGDTPRGDGGFGSTGTGEEDA